MNERIQKLADEAGLYVDLNGRPWPKSMSAEECEVAYKKFAELIVRECVGVADRSNVTSKSIVGERIKEHFGVDE